MNVIRHNPWSLFDRLGRDSDRYFARYPLANDDDEPYSHNDWVPAIDIREEESRYLLRADVPGVNVGDLDVTLDKGILTLRGSRETRTDEEEDGLRRVERISGRFYRRFSLPDTADSAAVSADYKNGVLEISIPKQEESQPQRIAVKVN